MVAWYLSFAGETGSLGACVVDAPGFMEAVLATHALGINPGGEVAGFEIPPGEQENDWERGRLFAPAELRERGLKTIREHEADDVTLEPQP